MKYILGVLAVVIILFAAIFWLATGDSNDQPAVTGRAPIELTEYADSGATAIYHMSGEIVAAENHREVRITINRNQRVFELLSGYDSNVVRRETFPNTSEAFKEFVYAIDLAGFANEQNANHEQVSGVCPEGRRTEYILREDSDEVTRLWSTSCNKKDGSLGGDRNLIKDLFEAQIPNYRELTRGVRF